MVMMDDILCSVMSLRMVVCILLFFMMTTMRWVVAFLLNICFRTLVITVKTSTRQSGSFCHLLSTSQFLSRSYDATMKTVFDGRKRIDSQPLVTSDSSGVDLEMVAINKLQEIFSGGLAIIWYNIMIMKTYGRYYP